MDAIPVTLQRRDVLGKKTKRLRARGLTPVHLYGRGVDSMTLQGTTPELIKVLARAGATTPLAITVEGDRQQHLAIVREIQWDPIRGDLMHVDFLRVEADRPVRSEVPIATTGHPARIPGATVTVQLHTVEIEAKPLEMPHEVYADLALLDAPDKIIRVRDLKLPTSVTLITDPDEVVAAFALAREEAAPAVEVAPGEVEEIKPEGKGEDEEKEE